MAKWIYCRDPASKLAQMPEVNRPVLVLLRGVEMATGRVYAHTLVAVRVQDPIEPDHQFWVSLVRESAQQLRPFAWLDIQEGQIDDTLFHALENLGSLNA